MKNISILWDNKIDSCAVAGGSWKSTLPLENIKSRELAVIARSQNLALASTQFSLTFSGRYPSIGAIALIDHNLGPAAKWRITASNANGNKTRSTGWLKVWPDLDSASMEWEDDHYWTGANDDETISQFNPVAVWVGGQKLWPTREDALNPKIWTIEIKDEENKNGFIDIARVFIGKVFTPVQNYSWGAKVSYVDDTVVTVGVSQREFFDLKIPRRVFKFTLHAVSDAEAYGALMVMQRRLGISGEVVCAFDYVDPEFYMQRTMYGRMRTLGEIEAASRNRNKCDFEIIESVG